MNRIKFGGESILLSPFVYGIGLGAKTLAKRGKELALSSSKIEERLDKLASFFRFRGEKPIELALASNRLKSKDQ